MAGKGRIQAQDSEAGEIKQKRQLLCCDTKMSNEQREIEDLNTHRITKEWATGGNTGGTNHT